jgi:triosephosphate isomerase
MDHDRPLPLVAGNWKMNGGAASLGVIDELAAGFLPGLRPHVELLVCPPATLIAACRDRAAQGGVSLGGQDCHAEPKGAFTGDLAAEMLADAGARYVIVGHSERRALHAESDAGHSRQGARGEAGRARRDHLRR